MALAVGKLADLRREVLGTYWENTPGVSRLKGGSIFRAVLAGHASCAFPNGAMVTYSKAIVT